MIRVLIVDDEALVRSGLRLILQAAGDIAVVAEASDGTQAVHAVRRHRPDVVLMDVRMPGMDGIAAAAQLARLQPPPKVIMLTTFDLDEYVYTALQHGAVGFLLKDTAPRDLTAAVRSVSAGDAMLAPSITRRLISAFTERAPGRAAGAQDRLARLTDREKEVAVALADGLSNTQIGTELGMAEATVKAHVSRALAKLGLDNRVQLAILVHETGLRG